MTRKPRAYALHNYLIPQYGQVNFVPCTMGGVTDYTIRKPGLWRVFVQLQSQSRQGGMVNSAQWFPAKIENFIKEHPAERPQPSATIAAHYMLKYLALYDGKDLYAYADKQEWPAP